jgi:SAM-dependent methyltransferase
MTTNRHHRRAAGHPDPVNQRPTATHRETRDLSAIILYDRGVADALFGEPRLAAIYDLVEGERRGDLDHYLAIADELGARSLLDVGCGTGILACRAASQGMDVTGVDPAAASLAVARAKPGADRVRWLHGDATGLPELQVDLATMTANVAHVFLTDEDWSATLRGVHAALRPGGHLVFEVRDPARQAWLRWTRENTYQSLDAPGIGRVETWWDVTGVIGELVSYRRTYVFAADGTTLTSDSTRRFWSRAEIEASLRSGGYVLAEVRDAPDRPGYEWVFIARKTG